MEVCTLDTYLHSHAPMTLAPTPTLTQTQHQHNTNVTDICIISPTPIKINGTSGYDEWKVK